MTTILRFSDKNPYQGSAEYRAIKTEHNVTHGAVVYHEKITYEKKLAVIYRIAIGTLAILAALTIIPYCLYSERVSIWWHKARSGVDTKIVMIIKPNAAQAKAQVGGTGVGNIDKDKHQKATPNKQQPAVGEKQPNDAQQASSGVKKGAGDKKAGGEVPSSPKQKRVQFVEARARIFDKDHAPAAVKEQVSVVLADFEDNNGTSGGKFPQVRKFPPVGLADTIVGNESAHEKGILFRDDEILEKLEIVKRVNIRTNELTAIATVLATAAESDSFSTWNKEIEADYTSHGKAIIQQQATRGCTAAVAAMLIMDNGQKPNLQELTLRNLGDDESILRDLKNAGLAAANSRAMNLSDLRKLIVADGSAIVSLTEALGGHVVVIDEVSKDLRKIRLRDPYHGWEITVSDKAFLTEWKGGKAIQVVKKSPM